MVATEVHLMRLSEQIDIGKEKRHRLVIDVCGFGEKYIPEYERNYKKTVVFLDGKEVEGRDYTQSQYKYNVTRGIEVKVSRNDLNNGFVMGGCNYHYLLTPKNLTRLEETPKHVGFIEVSLKKFNCKFDSLRNKFIFKGVCLRRNPRFCKIHSWQLDNTLANISVRCSRELISRTVEDLEKYSND